MKYKFDGSIDGIFSCILRCFLNRENPTELIDEVVQLSLTDEIIDVETDYENNKRIIAALYKYCGYNALCDLKYAFRSGDMKTALEYQNKLNLFIQTMFGFVNGRGLGYWKACLSLLGYDMGYTPYYKEEAYGKYYGYDYMLYHSAPI